MVNHPRRSTFDPAAACGLLMSLDPGGSVTAVWIPRGQDSGYEYHQEYDLGTPRPGYYVHALLNDPHHNRDPVSMRWQVCKGFARSGSTLEWGGDGLDGLRGVAKECRARVITADQMAALLAACKARDAIKAEQARAAEAAEG